MTLGPPQKDPSPRLLPQKQSGSSICSFKDEHQSPSLLVKVLGFFFGFTQLVGLCKSALMVLALWVLFQDGVAESVVGSQLVGFPELPYPLPLSHHHAQLMQEPWWCVSDISWVDC